MNNSNKNNSDLDLAKVKQLDSISKVLVTAAAALVFVLGLKFIATDLIAPILMAFFLAILIRPVFNFYRKKGLSSGWSLALVILTISLIFVGLIILITSSIAVLQNSLSIYTENIKNSINEVSQNLNVSAEATEVVTSSISPENITKIVSTILGSLGSITMYLIIVPILAILIILQMDKVPPEVASQMVKENPKFSKLSKFSESMMVYVVGRFKVNLVTGILFSIALLIIGVDFPYLWGILTVFLSFIPYIGIIIASTPPILLALADQGPWAALMVLGSVILINLFAENVLDPIVQGKGNKISPAVIIVSVIFWGWMLGAVGMILAAPLTVLLKLVLIEYNETAWLGQIIEGDYSGIPERSKATSSRFKNVKKSVRSIFPGSK